MGHGTEAMGLAPGDHVAVVVGNRTEFIEVLLGPLALTNSVAYLSIVEDDDELPSLECDLIDLEPGIEVHRRWIERHPVSPR